MNNVLRSLAIVPEALVYGPSHGYLQYLVRSPEPLDPQRTWDAINRELSRPVQWLRMNYPPSPVRRALLWTKQKQDHLLGISAHYDVSNEFYELFLDRKYMFYSCADFANGDETLEEAQTRKANFILDLIDPKPGEKILDLGCGWGAMLKRIHEETGDAENLYGYTLSKEQVAYNEQHNGFNVEFRNFITTSYPEAFYDKIYSIGAWEHVRPQEVLPLLQKLYRALKPGGRLVQHFFCRLADPLPAAATISQIFFPGSVNASYRFHLRAHEAAGFRVLRQSIHDYRPTLRAWFENLVRNRDRALELVGVPTYNRYLVFFPASYRYFQDGTGMLFRLQLEKPAR